MLSTALYWTRGRRTVSPGGSAIAAGNKLLTPERELVDIPTRRYAFALSNAGEVIVTDWTEIDRSHGEIWNRRGEEVRLDDFFTSPDLTGSLWLNGISSDGTRVSAYTVSSSSSVLTLTSD